MMTREEHGMAEYVGQFAAESFLDLRGGMPLGPCLTAAHEERLSQFADLFLELQQKPGRITVDPVTAGIPLRDLFNVLGELHQIHPVSLGDVPRGRRSRRGLGQAESRKDQRQAVRHDHRLHVCRSKVPAVSGPLPVPPSLPTGQLASP